jgi:histone acetyltransferase
MSSTAHLPQFHTHDDVIYKVVTNDGTPDAIMCLVNAKNVFSVQLPKMPKEYITRLVLDRNHRTMVIQHYTTGRIIGGICYRPFSSQRFAEIVFCAVTSTEQGKGYGKLIMSYLKEHVKNEGIDYFLTYADNYAIKYFAKQAFSKTITMHHDRWRNWIKDYDGATLMECGIIKEVNYVLINEIVKKQQVALVERIKNVSPSFREYSFGEKIQQEYQQQELLNQQNNNNTASTNTSTTTTSTTNSDDPSSSSSTRPNPSVFPIPLTSIPGAEKFAIQIQTYPPPRYTSFPSSSSDTSNNHQNRIPFLILTAKLSAILTKLTQSPDSWPFRSPVDRTVVVDYYNVISHPMDLTTMQSKLNNGIYIDSTLFEQDVALISHNCKVYNGPQTTYFKHAEEFWIYYVQLSKKYDLHDRLVWDSSLNKVVSAPKGDQRGDIGGSGGGNNGSGSHDGKNFGQNRLDEGNHGDKFKPPGHYKYGQHRGSNHHSQHSQQQYSQQQQSQQEQSQPQALPSTFGMTNFSSGVTLMNDETVLHIHL